MLLWQINIVVVDAALTTLSEQERAVRALLTSMTVGITSALQGSSASYLLITKLHYSIASIWCGFVVDLLICCGGV